MWRRRGQPAMSVQVRRDRPTGKEERCGRSNSSSRDVRGTEAGRRHAVGGRLPLGCPSWHLHYCPTMPLRHEPDAGHAAWFARSDAPWTQLCSLGPDGFERYGRLFHPLHEGADENDPDALVNVEGDLANTHLGRLTAILRRHTRTPENCFFGLWDGFGDIDGSPAVGLLGRGRGHPPQVPPAFPPEVLTSPRVEIPNRSYLLFRGPLAEAGHWAPPTWRPGTPDPSTAPTSCGPTTAHGSWPPRSTCPGPVSPAVQPSSTTSWRTRCST